MGREEGGGFRMGNTCFKIIKLKKKKIHIDPEPEKAMTTHSSVLAWKIPWTEDWLATVHGVAESQTQPSY